MVGRVCAAYKLWVHINRKNGVGISAFDVAVPDVNDLIDQIEAPVISDSCGHNTVSAANNRCFGGNIVPDNHIAEDGAASRSNATTTSQGDIVGDGTVNAGWVTAVRNVDSATQTKGRSFGGVGISRIIGPCDISNNQAVLDQR